MNNLVNWVHMLEDPETAGFLHGQELIFSTGIGHENTEWLLNFAKSLVANNASGLVLNIGPYIKAVPENLMSYCKEVQFPLFSMPWKTRIVDVTNHFCREIIRSEENDVSDAETFRNIIFFPERISEYLPVLRRKDYSLEAEYCVIALATEAHADNKRSDVEKYIKLNLSKILYSHSDRFNIFRQDQHIIIVLQNFPPQVVSKAIDQFYELNNFRSNPLKIWSGVSMNDRGIKTLSRSYKRAVALLPFALRMKKTKIFYSDIGLYQLLFEVEDRKVLKKFYNDSLKKLEDNDLKYHTDYLSTLKTYLDYNASVQEVAKVTFVHRNTINYKIRKIKEILGCELTFQDNLKFLLAFSIKDML